MTLLSTLASITIIGTSSLLVSGHTWIDSIQCNDGEKFHIRGYVKGSDQWNTYKIESRTSTANMCAPTQQSRTHDGGLLRCPAGSTVTLTYNPNGHVKKDTCEEGDPRVCGKVEFSDGEHDSRTTYWTIAAKAWTDDGQAPTVLRQDVADPSYAGPTQDQPYPNFEAFNNLISPGFKKPFNDGSCGEFNGVSTPCKGTFQIPDTAKGGMQFMFYWVFDRAYSSAGEEYTSCFDIEVTDATSVTTVGTFSESSTSSTPVPTQPTAAGAPTSSTPVPTQPTAAGAPTCIASVGDQSVGIQEYHDPTCGEGDSLGCVGDTKCRLCRVAVNNNDGIDVQQYGDLNGHLHECP